MHICIRTCMYILEPSLVFCQTPLEEFDVESTAHRSREPLKDKSGIASQLYYSNYFKGVWSWEIL